MEFTPEEVKLYLEAVLGYKRSPELSGMLRIPCLWPIPVRLPHDALMDPKSGRWQCLGDHGGGDLGDYERGRSRIHDHRQAEELVLKIIAESKEQVRREQEAARTAREKPLEGLPPYVKSLLRIIDDHSSGISQRDLHPRSHLRKHEFHKALRELIHRGLIRLQPGPGRHRPTTIYFPVQNPHP
ncbi:MAG TPA: helix-turn-helix domain-containing protein [Terriglobia bacterium]|nr:helix-turn-helix domain-containing protein [Terriglobia bacterium]